MQPFQYGLRCSAAQDNSITHAAVMPRNLDAAIAMRFADIALQNTMQQCTAAQKTAGPKPDLDATAEKSTILKAFK